MMNPAGGFPCVLAKADVQAAFLLRAFVLSSGLPAVGQIALTGYCHRTRPLVLLSELEREMPGEKRMTEFSRHPAIPKTIRKIKAQRSPHRLAVPRWPNAALTGFAALTTEEDTSQQTDGGSEWPWCCCRSIFPASAHPIQPPGMRTKRAGPSPAFSGCGNKTMSASKGSPGMQHATRTRLSSAFLLFTSRQRHPDGAQ